MSDLGGNPGINQRKPLSRREKFRIIYRAVLVLSILFALSYWISTLLPETNEILKLARDWRSRMGPELLLGACAIYAVCVALPFFPSIHVGLFLLVAFGARGAALVYVSTVAGLMLAFLVGRHLPTAWILRLYNPRRGIFSQKNIVEKPEPSSNPLIVSKFSEICFRLKRGIALIVLLNLPGNTIYGDGGGVSIICGMDRRFSAVEYLIVCMIASAPVPLLIGLGLLEIESLLS